MKKIWFGIVAITGMMFSTQVFAAPSHFSDRLYFGDEWYIISVDVINQDTVFVAYNYSNKRYSIYESSFKQLQMDQDGVGTFRVDEITGKIDFSNDQMKLHVTK